MMRRTEDTHSLARLRLCVTGLIVLIPLAAFVGRMSAQDAQGQTVRQVEALPEPAALPADIHRFHDAVEEVTCWTFGTSTSGGIACLPDQWLASARIETDPAPAPAMLAPGLRLAAHGSRP